MYINPFWCGVLFTILVEIGLFTVALIVSGTKKGNNDNEKH